MGTVGVAWDSAECCVVELDEGGALSPVAVRY